MFVQAKDQQVITRCPRIVTECLLARFRFRCTYMYMYNINVRLPIKPCLAYNVCIFGVVACSVYNKHTCLSYLEWSCIVRFWPLNDWRYLPLKPARASLHHFVENITYMYTPGNVVRGNQNYANESFTGASGHELQSVGRMLTNQFSHYLLISKRENRQFGNMVPHSFHFYTRLITKIQGKPSFQPLIWFLVWDKFIPLHLARDILNEKSFACISMSNHFFVGAEMKVIENHIVRFSKIYLQTC